MTARFRPADQSSGSCSPKIEENLDVKNKNGGYCRHTVVDVFGVPEHSICMGGRRQSNRLIKLRTTAKKDSDAPKKDGDKTPSSTEVSNTTPAPASAVEGEIQQLREALSEQQALLQTQQARIAQLENQLHVGQGQPVALATGPRVRRRLDCRISFRYADRGIFKLGAADFCRDGFAKSASVGRYAETRRASHLLRCPGK